MARGFWERSGKGIAWRLCGLTLRRCTRRDAKFEGKKIPDPARAGDEEVDLSRVPSQTFLGVPTGLGAGGAGAGGAGGASSTAGAAGAGAAGTGADTAWAAGVADITLAGAAGV